MSETKRQTFEQLLDQIHQVAQDPDAGPDRFRAAKLLLSMESAQVGLEEPLTDPEMIELLKRVMRPAGKTNCQIAFRQAFHQSKDGIDAEPDVLDQHLTAEERAFCRKITSVRLLNRHFPEISKNGIHKGQPRGKGEATLRAWLYKTSVECIRYRKKHMPVITVASGGTDAQTPQNP